VGGLGLDGEQALRLALGAGDDYELCFAAAPGRVEPLVSEFTGRFGVELTCVGRVTEGQGVALQRPDGSEAALEYGGYDHFHGGAG
jgi:thiamine-monophosphate kinase